MRAIILPESWCEEASIFIARLNIVQSRYFIISLSESKKLELDNKWTDAPGILADIHVRSAMFILPTLYACGDKIDLWPSMIQTGPSGNWVSSLFFADSWAEVANALLDVSTEEETSAGVLTHLTCQYQPPYTAILSHWYGLGRKAYHPGDYFKEDILPALTEMRGNWIYWGHGEGDKLRGYSHLHTADLLSYKCSKPLNATLWFTCSTLDRGYPENIALAWYLSGASKCMLASPEKVNTEDNQLLSDAWMQAGTCAQDKTISCVIMEILQKDPEVYERILNQYFLLGIPWVQGKI